VTQIKEFTLFEIAELTNSKVVGDEKFIVNNLATLKSSNTNSISFF
jgi:UDP-3-O-[3-hydroxymyristoyl] glucosamine N-acyltransferase